MDKASLKTSEILEELELLRSEIKVVLPYTRGMWGTETDQGNRHFPNTIHGFMMAAMAKVDYLSQHWIRKRPKGKHKDGQTKRMVQFMHSYLGYGKEASEIAVQFFRHNLMHASDLAEIHDDKGGSYRWLLHHGDGSDPARDKHMVLRECLLNFGVLYFVEDLISTVPKLKAAIMTDPEILLGWDGIESEIRSFTKKY